MSYLRLRLNTKCEMEVLPFVVCVGSVCVHASMHAHACVHCRRSECICGWMHMLFFSYFLEKNLVMYRML